MTDKDYATDITFNRKLITDLLDDYALDKYNKLPDSQKSYLVHRHQLLYLIKSAFLYCAQNAQTDFTMRKIRNILGRCCLLANDFIYLTKASPEELDSSSEDHLIEILWKELLASYELYVSPDLVHAIGRNKIIFERILPNMPHDRSYMDLTSLFHSITKMTINEFRDLIFAITALYLTRRKEILGNTDAIICNTSNLTQNTKISPELIDRLLELISLPLEQYADEINRSKDKELNYGFLVLRKYPLCTISKTSFVCLDFDFLVEKITAGIFWLINDKLPQNERNSFRSFWGTVFEAYIKAFLLSHPALRDGLFTPSPCYDGGDDEIADGFIIYDQDLVILEFKFTNLTLESKHSPSVDDLIREIRTKFEKSQSGEWKGYGQLANCIKKLFVRDSRATHYLIKKEKIRRIFPILITYEHFFNSPFTNYQFNKYFRELIDSPSLRPNIEVMPLTLISIDDLEASQPFLGEINEVILERLRIDPKLTSSYSDFMKNKYRNDPSLKCEWIDTEYRKFGEEARGTIFGGE